MAPIPASRTSRRNPSAQQGASSFPQAVVAIPDQWRQQIAEDRARAGLDFDGDGHSGGQVDELVVDLHLRTIERNPRGEIKLLTFRLAGFAVGTEVLFSRPIRGLV